MLENCFGVVKRLAALLGQAMGEAAAAEGLLEEGRQLVTNLDMAGVPAASPLHKKLESISTFLRA